MSGGLLATALAALARDGFDLPAAAALPELLAALGGAGRALLVAPPGTGKTTLAPLALADALTESGGPGRVVVTEPRRVAVRAAAGRMAALLGEDVGGAVGYAVRGERRTSARTRVEVVTTGLLLRRLQADPELPGTGAVLLDEVHERALDADLALALVVDARAVLRPDLWLVAASATPDQAALRRALAGAPPPDPSATDPSPPDPSASSEVADGAAGPVPVVVATAPVHPLAVVHDPPPPGLDPPQGLRVDPRLLEHVAAATARALDAHPGDVLVVLPGAREIARVQARLRAARPDVDVLALHGRTPRAEQDRALRPGPRRRVVVASAVAESSLTVPGVRVVVDAGLARVPRTDHARGLAGLDTVRVSRASAEQRAGRAAREGPGVVVRCWSAADDARLPPRPEPEVATADLAGALLALACWGSPRGEGLALPDPLPAGAVAAAERALGDRGLLDAAGRATPLGREVAGTGLDPRLGRALLLGARAVGPRAAAEVVALLSEDGPGGGAGAGDDLVAAWRALRRGDDAARSAAWRREVERLRGSLRSAADRRPTTAGPGSGAGGLAGDEEAVAGLVVALAHPERVGRRRRGADGAERDELLLVGGTGARLTPGSAWSGSSWSRSGASTGRGDGPAPDGWLAVARLDRPLGSADAVVRLAAPVSEDAARLAAAPLLETEEEVAWVGGAGGDVRARRVERLGAVVLAEAPLTDPLPEALQAALLDGLGRAGLALLAPSDAAERLRLRLAALRAALGEPWPDVSPEALVAGAAGWLAPELAAARRRSDLARTDVATALRRLLPWPQASRLDELAPERLALPSGRTARLDYADPLAPVLAVRLQDVLGWQDAPRVADGRTAVVVHLLSPAGRPLAVTGDLASFWRGPYAQVRAEMRGRYPKHAWPEDPLAR
ncbi:ATP-dependent RNA helicase [uncultured Pseudokineococcus sp.]|uniref:ATP-dependent RNA helicase n=1 Tax=uncultured Pseudokineococcus sp. TaxID=1642928 RepID=UPI0026096A84|nr:ATP-dependent helicase C-terminal domain-containing protein [uncultured Pseudokineococcus sp.]